MKKRDFEPTSARFYFELSYFRIVNIKVGKTNILKIYYFNARRGKWIWDFKGVEIKNGVRGVLSGWGTV